MRIRLLPLLLLLCAALCLPHGNLLSQAMPMKSTGVTGRHIQQPGCLVQNPSFEGIAGSLSTTNLNPIDGSNVPGWMALYSSPDICPSPVNWGGTQTAFDGSYYAGLSSGGGATEVLGGTLTSNTVPGNWYSVGARFSQAEIRTPPGVWIEIYLRNSATTYDNTDATTWGQRIGGMLVNSFEAWQPFVSDVLASGAYDQIMIKGDMKASTPEYFLGYVFIDSVDVCRTAEECSGNIIKNGSFSDGAIEGSMPSGQTANWTGAYAGGSGPDVALDGGCGDAAYIGMWGNQVVGEAIQQTLGSQIIQGHSYSISFCARWIPEQNRPYPVQFAFRASNNPLTGPTDGTGELIGISPPIDPQGWMSVTLPNWTATGSYSILTVSATNQSSFDHGDSTTYGHIDQICVNDVTITGVGDAPKNPTNFILYQNYPNPFNPSTTIEYALPESALVTLVVHDLYGREVAKLVHETQGPGRHSARFDARNLPSGLYIYRLHAEGFVATKPMLLMK